MIAKRNGSLSSSEKEQETSINPDTDLLVPAIAKRSSLDEPLDDFSEFLDLDDEDDLALVEEFDEDDGHSSP